MGRAVAWFVTRTTTLSEHPERSTGATAANKQKAMLSLRITCESPNDPKLSDSGPGTRV